MVRSLNVLQNRFLGFLLFLGFNPTSEVVGNRGAGQSSTGKLLQDVIHRPPDAGLGENFFAALPRSLFPTNENGICRSLVGSARGTANAPAVSTGKTAPPKLGIWSLNEMRHTVTNNVTISPCKQTSQVDYLLCWSHLQRGVNPRAGSSPATGTSVENQSTELTLESEASGTLARGASMQESQGGLRIMKA